MSNNLDTAGKFGDAVANISQNRTLFVLKCTKQPPVKPQLVQGLQSVNQVFAHFTPAVDIDFELDGTYTTERLRFEKMEDFSLQSITRQSVFLRKSQQRQEQYFDLAKKISTNPLLRSALENAEARQALLKTIETMILELNNHTQNT